jgi:hypothetical protein
MTRSFASTLIPALVIAGSLYQGTACTAQSAQAGTQPALAHASAKRGTIAVELVKALDSRKLKQGDKVEAELTSAITLPDGTVVPHGTPVIGHVTEATARSQSDASSSLGISFDTIRQKEKDTPIHGVIQAVAPSPHEELNTGGSGFDYGADEEKATTVVTAPNTGRDVSQVLNETSRGVLGIKNLQLGSNGVLTSAGKEVKLSSGVRMLLSITLQ